MKASVQALVNSNIFIGIAALMAVFQFYILTDGHIWIGFLEVVVFTGTVIIYNLHRFLSLPAKKNETNSAMQLWMLRHKKALLYFNIFLGLHLLIAFFLVNSKIQWALTVLGLIALFYAIPFFSWQGKTIKIRDFGTLKPFVLGATWAGVTVILPYFNSEQYISTSNFVLLFLERFFFISALCIPFDIRDYDYDAKNMLHPSIPNRLGVSNSILLTKVLLLIYTVVSIVHYSFLQQQHFFSLAAVLVTGILFLLLRKNISKQSAYFFTFYLDGSIILQSLLIFAAAYLNYRLL